MTEEKIRESFDKLFKEKAESDGYDKAIAWLMSVLPVQVMKKQVMCTMYQSKTGGQIALTFGCSRHNAATVCGCKKRN